MHVKSSDNMQSLKRLTNVVARTILYSEHGKERENLKK